ncbi:MAG TPA: ATP-binding protein [Solirubrobacteraceae bacterium]|nr:ATP-binding protein [Solirubrobacteraceae bacterium]
MTRRGESRMPARDAGPPPRIGTAVARFTIGSLLAIAVVVIGGYLALRSVATDQAVRDTRERVQSAGRLLETAGLSDGLLRGDQQAIDKLDGIVRGSVRTGPIVRVKLWSRDGTVIYSDERALIGHKFPLAADDRALFDGNRVAAELSDVKRPENRFERGQGELLEAYSIVHTPGGTPLLFEIYQRFSSVTADGSRLLRAEAPPLLGGLIVLMLFQVPLAWSLGRRLQRVHRDRAALLANAVEASAQERRRIASDLHDGVVQNVAGVAFGLAPLAQSADRRGEHDEAEELRRSIAQLRQGVRDMRTLLVEIHPPNLESVGLEAALNDLLSPLEAGGIATTLDIDTESAMGDAGDALVYRVAREAIRNVESHAQADSIHVGLSRPSRAIVRLAVTDDGKGFEPVDRKLAGADGHVGLTLLENLVEQAGGRLAISSQPGEGTTVVLELACEPRQRSGGDGRPRSRRAPEAVPVAGEGEVGRADVEVVAK